LNIEKKHSQKVTKFKVAVLYVKNGQKTMPDVFANKPPEGHGFYKLLDSMADKINLKGWTKYRGDFGSDSDEKSYYTEWKVSCPSLLLRLSSCKGVSMMFHVAPWLNSEMHRRLIGNDICVLVYFDEPDPATSLDPIVFDGLGTVPQVFTVVQPINEQQYRLGFFHRSNLKRYGPDCPPSDYVFSREDLRDYLFTKLHNGFAMGMQCPPMNRLFITPRAATLKVLPLLFSPLISQGSRREVRAG
jgi:hypothetical protein